MKSIIGGTEDAPLLGGGEAKRRSGHNLLAISVIVILVALNIFQLYSSEKVAVSPETENMFSGEHNRVWPKPDLGDAINLFNGENDVKQALNALKPNVVEEYLEKVNQKMRQGWPELNMPVSGWQVSLGFGCNANLIDHAEGWGYRAKNVSALIEKYPLAHIDYLPEGEAASWEHMFERNDNSVTPDTPIHIGSVTKVVTSYLAFIMRDQGIISLDEPLANEFPELDRDYLMKVNPSYARLGKQRNVTLRMAMGHATGIKRDMCMDFAPSKMEEQIGTYGAFTSMENMNFDYSNQMTALVGKFISMRTGMSYEELLQKYVFGPLGMTNSFAEVPSDPSARHEVLSKQRCGADLMPKANTSGDALRMSYFLMTTNFHRINDMAPAGSIISTARDFSKFIRALNPSCNLDEREDGRLSPSSLREFLGMGIVGGSSYLGIGTSTAEMGSTLPNNHRVWSKGGAIGTYGTGVYFIPDAHLHLVLSSNTKMSVPLPATHLLLNETNIVGPVMDTMKKRLDDSYSGNYKCEGKKDDEEEKYAVNIKISFRTTGSSGNPNEFLALEHLGGGEAFGSPAGTVYPLSWTGRPFEYVLKGESGLGIFMNYKSFSPLSESLGAQHAQTILFDKESKNVDGQFTQANLVQTFPILTSAGVKVNLLCSRI
eukprot:Nk52_evm6s559 gene=Nk52_evmTU6s559